MDNRRLVADLAQVTAERDGLRIAVRMRDATIEEAARTAAALGEKIDSMSDEIDGIRSLLRRDKKLEMSRHVVSHGKVDGVLRVADTPADIFKVDKNKMPAGVPVNTSN